MRAACVWIGLSALSALSSLPGCDDGQPPEIGVGGTVAGLTGQGLVLRSSSGEDLDVSGDGPFRFATTIDPGTPYAVAVAAQPVAPSQLCIADNAIGVAGEDDVTGVMVGCTTRIFRIGGTVAGLAGAGLVLRNNGGDDIAVGADGRFMFPTPIESGQPFDVTIAHQPSGPSQTCAVAGGSGSVGAAAVTTVTIDCDTDRFAVGGTVTGLAGTLVLQDNRGEQIAVTANGTFALPTLVASGQKYRVTILKQPTAPSQTCAIVNDSGEGEVTDDDVKGIEIECATNQFAVGGQIWGLHGSGLVLENNGGDTLPIETDGDFLFPTLVPSGQHYHVTISSQPTRPWQLCSVLAGAGTVGGRDAMDAFVACTTLTFPIGGTVTGIPTDSYIVLTNNGHDALTLTSDGAFVFDTVQPSGTSYLIQLAYTSPGLACSIADGDGNLGGAPIRDITVTCWPLEVDLIDTAPTPVGTTTACDMGYGVEVDARAAQTLTGIELPLSVTAPAQVRFVIANANTGESLYTSDPIAVATGATSAASPTMSFPMLPGTVYAIGAIVQGCAALDYDWTGGVDHSTRTTAHTHEFTNFDDPAMSADPPSPMDLRVRLRGTQP